MDNPIFLHFVTLTIFCLMFAIGINHSSQQLTSLWRQPGLLLRSFLAVIVLVPIWVGLLVWLIDLPPATATGLAVLAAAPGAPLTTKRTQAAGGDPEYAASLQLTLALLAVVVTPLILAICYAQFELLSKPVPLAKVALQVGEVTFLPVIIGLLIQRLAPKFAERIGTPAQKTANILFILLFIVLIVVFLLKPELRAMLDIGWPATAAIVIMVVISLLSGHLLGGPIRKQRSVLAVASIARNLGLAMFIANVCDYGQQFIPTLLTYAILGALLAVPYSIWSKRRMT